MAIITENTPVSAEMPDETCRRWLETHLHRHDYREILFVETGVCPVRIGRHDHVLHAGDLALLESMVQHSAGHLPDAGGLYWWFTFWNGNISLIQWQFNKIDVRGAVTSRFLHDFIYQLWDDFRTDGDPDAAWELAAQCRVIGRDLLRGGLRMPEEHAVSGRDAVIRKILKYMEDMPSLNCTLDTLARLAGVSRVHFQRIFRAYTGSTFREYLNRMREERYRLYTGRIPQKELADCLGFTSSAALLHWKKRCMKPDPEVHTGRN